MRSQELLLLVVVGVCVSGCGQRPRLDVQVAVEGGRVVFDVPRTDVRGLLGLRDEAGAVFWQVKMDYYRGRHITYGRANIDAHQIIPADGSAPPDIRGRRVRVRVKYQYDDPAPSAAEFEKTVDVP